MRTALLVVAATALLGLAALAGAARSTNAAAAKIDTAKNKLGTILVDGQGRTLYLFEKDARNHSACSGACAKFWPPELTTGKPVAGAGVKVSLLGEIMRSDGTDQVTYNGHPLYRFVKDTSSGQTTGQAADAFGAGWYVIAPNGSKIDHS
jgi:predicted lipoprotein with Yx(FWY)xxD motif